MRPHRPDQGRLVYTTEHGSMCPGCSRPIAECACRAEEPEPVTDGVVRVGRETKGRKGKAVTVVTGVPLRGSELAKLCKDLKRCCGTGGTSKNGVIEIQGDHRDVIVGELVERGWSVKRAGG